MKRKISWRQDITRRGARAIPSLLLALGAGWLALPLPARTADPAACVQSVPAAGAEAQGAYTTEDCPGAASAGGTRGVAYLRWEPGPDGTPRTMVVARVITGKAHRHAFLELTLNGNLVRLPNEVREMAPLASGDWQEVDAAEISRDQLQTMRGDVPLRLIARRGVAEAVLPQAHHRALAAWLAAR